MFWVVSVAIAGLAIGVGWTIELHRELESRWDPDVTPATLVGTRGWRGSIRKRGMPRSVKLAAVLSPMWGLLTGLVFAPAGTLFSLSIIGAGSWGLLLALLVVLVSVHGFGLAVSLSRATQRIVERDAEPVAFLAGRSALHHTAVLAVFGAVALFVHEASLVLWIAIPCGVGLVHALLLHGAARAMR